MADDCYESHWMDDSEFDVAEDLSEGGGRRLAFAAVTFIVLTVGMCFMQWYLAPPPVHLHPIVFREPLDASSGVKLCFNSELRGPECSLYYPAKRCGPPNYCTYQGVEWNGAHRPQ